MAVVYAKVHYTYANAAFYSCRHMLLSAGCPASHLYHWQFLQIYVLPFVCVKVKVWTLAIVPLT